MKFYAILLGTYGIGISSQLLNLNYFIIFIGTVGFPVGLTKYISQWENEGNWKNIILSIKQVLSILFFLSILGIVLSVIFAKQFSILLLDSPEYSLLIFFVFCSFPFTAFTSVLDSFVKGIKKFGLSVKASIALSISTLIISIILVLLYNLTGVAVGLLISSVSGAFIYYIILHKERLLNISDIVKYKNQKNPALKNIIKLGFASLIVGGLGQFTQLMIRSMVIREIGIDSNGIYQCIYSISNNYFNIFFMTISIYSLPILSEMKDKYLINLELNNILRITLLIIVPILVVTYTFRDLLIITLYTEKFLSASNYMLINFSGDFFKALAWVFGAWLIPATKIKTWAAIDIILNINYFVIFYLLITFFNLGLYSVVIAYAVSFVIHSLISFAVLKKYNNFSFLKNNLRFLIYSAITILIIFYISSINKILSFIIILPVLLIWLRLSVKNEEIRQVKNYIKEIIAGIRKKSV